MWFLIFSFLKGLTQKVLPVAVVILLVLGGTILFFFLRDRLDSEATRTNQLEALLVKEEALVALREEAQERLGALQEQYGAAQDRYRQAERLLGNLEALRNFWHTLFQSREEREHQQKRLLWAEQKKKEITWSLEDIEAQLTVASGHLQRLDQHMADLRQEREALERAESEMFGYASRAWATLRQPLLLAVAAYFLSPTVWKFFCFYLWAPFLRLGGPILLREGMVAEISAATSQVSKRVSLKPGERAVLKEKFLQASDEALRRRTRFIFDWRIPFSSAACGLIELTEMINSTDDRVFSITFSTQEDPTMELSEILLPAGASLVLRPSYLAGVITAAGEHLRIDRHWRLFSIHAWVTLQFRYFEFHGPCRLIVCGKRGVRAEMMSRPLGEAALARRTNQDSTIGFTPNLSYHSARAETFWAYYRGRNPLFDDLFRGSAGAFLCQEITSRDHAYSARRFWNNFWGGLLKIFGL